MTRSCWRASGGTIYATSTRATKPKQPCGCTTITTSKSLALVDDKSAVQLTRYTTDRNNFKLHAAGVGDMFTPIETSLGALLLHSGVTHFLANDGKILGCSGILRSSIRSPSQSRETSLPSLVGIACSAPLLALTAPFLLPTYPAWTLTGASALSTIALGALTGWGTKVRVLLEQ